MSLQRASELRDTMGATSGKAGSKMTNSVSFLTSSEVSGDVTERVGVELETT
jgi:hypothetical protein